MTHNVGARNPIGSGSTSNVLSMRTFWMVVSFAIGLLLFILIPLAIAQAAFSRGKEAVTGEVAPGIPGIGSVTS